MGAAQLIVAPSLASPRSPVNATSGRDLTRGVRGILIWGVPILILAVTANLGGVYPAIAWPLALAFMGAVCLVNALRCGRRHCYFTGPYFLLLATLSLLYGLGILDLGKRDWSWLSLALVIGAFVLICVPEWLFGKYAHRSGAGQGP